MARDTKSRVEAAQKRRLVLEARIAGKTYDEAAKVAGYATRGAARKAMMTAMSEITREPAKELLELQMSRLDLAMTVIVDRLLSDDGESGEALFAIDRLVKVIGEQSKLTGLYNIEAEDDGAARAAAALVALVDKSREAVGAPPLSTPEPATDDDQETVS